MLLEALANPPPPTGAAREAVRTCRSRIAHAGGREAGSRIVIEPFDPARPDRSGLSCGTARLDNVLRFSTKKRQKDDFTRIFVAVAMGTIPAPCLSMIAVDESWQGRRLGSDLAVDAPGRALNVAREAGLKLVVPDVIDDGGNEAFARRLAGSHS